MPPPPKPSKAKVSQGPKAYLPSSFPSTKTGWVQQHLYDQRSPARSSTQYDVKANESSPNTYLVSRIMDSKITPALGRNGKFAGERSEECGGCGSPNVGVLQYIRQRINTFSNLLTSSIQVCPPTSCSFSALSAWPPWWALPPPKNWPRTWSRPLSCMTRE